MDTLWHDLRYGLRMLTKSPGFTAVAILTLALGIGANTAIFSVVNAVLLRPLPFDDPDRLVLISENNLQKGWESFSVAPPNFIDWRSQTQVFEDMSSMRGASYNFTGGQEPERLAGARVSASFFPILGVPPLLGRTFLAEEDQPGRDQVVVLSYAFWQRSFGGDPGIVGQTITLNGEVCTVIGVMPAGFQIPGRALVWRPAAFTPQQLQSRGSHFMSVIGRLNRGVSLDQARAEMTEIARRLAEQYPDSNEGWGVNVNLLHEEVVGAIRPALRVLLGAVGFVLLIACANVANLLLGRATARQKEIAIRAALGAGRSRIVRQLLTESTLLSLAGGGLGLLPALWGIELIRSLNPGTIPRADGIDIDPWVLGFTLGVAVLTGMFFGVAPAVQASRLDLNETLKEGSRSASAGRRRHRLRRSLVVAEVALALVLLVGSGLLLKSFWRLQSVDPGFQAENLLTATVVLPRAKYETDPQQASFFSQVLERLRSLPGVRSATTCTTPPLSGNDFIFSFQTESQRDARPQDLPSANYYAVSPDYFQTMDIRLIEGRPFTEQDDSTAPRVAIINQTLARRFFPNESPLGKRLSMGINSSVWREIVGVVGDVHHYSLEHGPTLQMYEPYLQQPFGAMSIVLRTEFDPTALVGALRAQIQAVDTDQPLAQVRTGEEILADAVSQPRFRTVLLALFASLALVLAAVGLYGVISYAVTQQTHEIGIRIALGAERRDIFKLVITQGMILTLIGVGLGLGAAFVLTRFLSILLFGVSATDSLTFASISVLLTSVALVACYLPARRATRVDPMVALRYE